MLRVTAITGIVRRVLVGEGADVSWCARVASIERSEILFPNVAPNREVKQIALIAGRQSREVVVARVVVQDEVAGCRKHDGNTASVVSMQAIMRDEVTGNGRHTRRTSDHDAPTVIA
jgi:hypothetical protein